MESVDDVTRRRRRQDELCGAEVLPGGMTKQNKTKKNNFDCMGGGRGNSNKQNKKQNVFDQVISDVTLSAG